MKTRRPEAAGNEPGPAPAAAEPFAVLDSYWQALRRGVAADVQDWLRAHPDGPDGRADLEVLAALHEARQELEAGQAGPAGDAGVLVPGSRLGECRIEALLGRGGMGEVYRAAHRVLHCPVAVKVLPARLAHDPEAVRRFRRSLRLQARLGRHPRLAAALHASRHAGRLYLVMEFVAGTDLKTYVQRRGTLPADEACALVREAAEGLDYLHRRGVVHRDIKPSNLMRTPEGAVKILDLGLARRALGTEAGDADALLGTADFMAPEQARASHRADARSDLYSLGCTFYYLLTGRPPFPDGSVVEKLLAHARQAPRPVRELRPEVAPAVAAVVDRLLAKRPAERYPSARAVLDALDSLEAAPVVPPRRHRLTLAALLLTLAVLAAGLLRAPAPGPQPAPTAVPEAAVPALEELTLLVQRGAEQEGVPRYGRHRLVARGAEQEVAPPAPLKAADSFRLEGTLEGPAWWHLVWIDTREKVTVAESSLGPQRALAYPPGPEFQAVDANDPPGMHLLLLVAGPLPCPKGELEARLAGLGRPPAEPAASWARLLNVSPGQVRGPGERVPAAEGWPEVYLRRVRERMPSGLTAVHALFLPTE